MTAIACQRRPNGTWCCTKIQPSLVPPPPPPDPSKPPPRPLLVVLEASGFDIRRLTPEEQKRLERATQAELAHYDDEQSVERPSARIRRSSR